MRQQHEGMACLMRPQALDDESMHVIIVEKTFLLHFTEPKSLFFTSNYLEKKTALPRSKCVKGWTIFMSVEKL